MKKCVGCLWLVKVNSRVSFCPFASCFVNKKKEVVVNHEQTNHKTAAIR